MQIEKTFFGKTKDDKAIDCYKLISSDGSYVSILNYGLIIQKLVVPNKNNDLVNVVLGYNSLRDYEDYSPYYGCIVGRYAGRIANGQFTINQKTCPLDKQDGKLTLHGGTKGFNQKIYSANAYLLDDKAIVEFSTTSAHLEQGFPGELTLKVVYTFDETKQLSIEYFAETTEDTIISLTNHSYFNLTGNYSNINNQMLYINADKRMTLADDMCPNGICAVDAVFDFRIAKPIGQYLADKALKATKGYDHPYKLNKNEDVEIILADNDSGIKLAIETTEKCVVLYTQNYLAEKPTVYDDIKIAPHHAVCLETQYYPNSINIKGLEKVLRKGELYHEKTVYHFGLINSDYSVVNKSAD